MAITHAIILLKDLNSPMRGIHMGKQRWIPVHVDDVEEVDEAVVVYPKNSIVEHLGTLWVEVEGPAQLRSPVFGVQFGVVALPSQVGPGVLEEEEPLALKTNR